MRLDPGASLRSPEGYDAVLLPLFHQPVDILLYEQLNAVRENDLVFCARWDCEAALYLHNKGLVIKAGYVRFIYLHYKVARNVASTTTQGTPP